MTSLLSGDARLVEPATGRVHGGDGLADAVADRAARLLETSAGPVFLAARLDLETVVTYLACWESQRAVALIDPGLDRDALEVLLNRYRPATLAGEWDPVLRREFKSTDAGGGLWTRDASAAETHPDLGVLLATSGSTGSPKLVRLSWSAVTANARSIATALSIGSDEVAPTSLPIFYSYGLSVLNSHLAVGATVVLTTGGILDRAFWTAFDDHRCTSLAGVPYHYSMLRRLRFDPSAHQSLRTLTQAGGRLAPELVQDFASRIEAVGGRMFVMYGQTEATARIAVVPPDRLLEKVGSGGRAVPGGRLQIADLDQETGVGEVVYQGPNVMMGYAESAEDLRCGDDLGGTLRTGDLGYLDDEGFLFLTGRSKRIGKVFGVRVNLDDIEHLLRDRGPVAALPGSDAVIVWLEGSTDENRRVVSRWLAEQLHLHASGFDVRSVERLPLLGNGKIDYRSLEGET